MSLYKCSACNYQSYYSTNVKNHVNRKRKCSDEQIPSLIKIDVEIKCDYCNKNLCDMNGLKVHIKTCKIKNDYDRKQREKKKIEDIENNKIKNLEKRIKKLEHIQIANVIEEEPSIEISKLPIYNKDENEFELLKQKIELLEKENTLLKKEKVEIKKKNIPASVRHKLWTINFGDTTIGHCMVCETKINNTNFHAGHIVSSKNGGSDHITNLSPICSCCNLSMGIQNLNDFKSDYFN